MRLRVGRCATCSLTLATALFAFVFVSQQKMSVILKNEDQTEHEMQYTIPSTSASIDLKQYQDKLRACSSPRNVILLALVDTSFLDMTLNFYETSLLKFNITNYLFIASDYEACRVLQARNINCYVYMTDKDANLSTVYNTPNFKRKMNIRIFFILDALKAGFTVLHSDVDIVFFQNPLTRLQDSKDGDILCLWDSSTCNAGFLYVKPSKFSIDVYTAMKDTAFKTTLDDQRALSKALGKDNRLRKKLPISQYQCGVEYFEKGHRFFADSAPCPKCVVIHNNWIVSKEAKRYRFREVLLWSYDDNGYYSNKTTKYLTYSNPIVTTGKISNKSLIQVELDVLKTALYLGHVLKRVVILPRLHLVTGKGAIFERPLNQWIRILSFDGMFYGKYRENSFLHHPKVPREVKASRTKPFWVRTDRSMAMLGAEPKNVSVLTPSTRTTATTDQILDWFGHETSAILDFHSLYGVFGNDFMPRNKETADFRQRLQKAFKRASYRNL